MKNTKILLGVGGLLVLGGITYLLLKKKGTKQSQNGVPPTSSPYDVSQPELTPNEKKKKSKLPIILGGLLVGGGAYLLSKKKKKSDPFTTIQDSEYGYT